MHCCAHLVRARAHIRCAQCRVMCAHVRGGPGKVTCAHVRIEVTCAYALSAVPPTFYQSVCSRSCQCRLLQPLIATNRHIFLQPHRVHHIENQTERDIQITNIAFHLVYNVLVEKLVQRISHAYAAEIKQNMLEAVEHLFHHSHSLTLAPDGFSMTRIGNPNRQIIPPCRSVGWELTESGKPQSKQYRNSLR